MTSEIQNDSSNARKKNVNNINEWKPPLDWDSPLPVTVGEESQLCLYNNGVSEDFDAASVDSGYSLMSFGEFVDADVAPDVLYYGTPLSKLGYTSPEGFAYDETEVSLHDRVHAALGDSGSHILHYLSFAGERPPVCSPFESHKEAVRSFKQGFCIGAYLLEMDRFEQRKLVEYCEFAHKNARKKSPISLPRSQHLTGPAQVSTKKPSDDVHILYAKGYPRVPKPNSYDVHSFRVWVHGESSHIWRTSTTEIPVLGHSALALYKGSVASKQANAQMLGLATVQRSNWSTVKCKYSTTDPLRTTITVGMFHFTSMYQFELLAHLFLKHKPVFKTLRRFFDGDTTVDGSVLSATLEKVLHTGTWDEVAAVLARESLNEPVRQGLSQSTTRAVAQTLHEEDHMNTLGRDFGKGITEGMFTALPEASVNVIRAVLNSVLGLSAMALSSSPLQFSIILAQTLLNDPVAYSYAERHLQPYLQGDSDDKAPTEWYTELFSIGVFSSLRDFFGDVYSALIPSFLELCGALKFASVKAMAQSAATWIADKLYELMLRVKGCWKHQSLSPLWGVDPARWCSHTLGIQAYWSHVVSRGDGKLLRELISRDEIPNTFSRHMTHTEFCELLTVHIEHGESMLSVVAGKAVGDMKYALRTMTNLRSQVSLSIDNCASRVKPFTVLFYSEPGTGKTTQADKLGRALVSLEGRDSQDIYYFVNENFRTTLRSNTMLVRMDDPDAGATGPVAGFEDHCLFLQKLSSSQPYPIEQAGVDEKGKHFARPTDIIIATNSKDLKATTFLTEPSAVWRRVEYYIESVVKEAYATNGRLNTKLLDIPLDSACVYNVFEYSHAGEAGKELTLRPVKSRMEWAALCRFLLEAREKHLTKQRTLLNISDHRCHVCGFPDEACVCEIPLDGPDDEEQKSEEPIMQGAGSSRSSWSVGPKQPYAPGIEELDAKMSSTTTEEATLLSESVERVRAYFTLTNGLGLLCGTTGVVAAILGIVNLFRIYQQGREAGVEQDSWFRTKTVVEPGLPKDPPATWSYEELCQVVRGNLVSIKGIGPGSASMQGVVFCPGWVLFPTHCFGAQGIAEFSISGRVVKVRQDHSKRLMNAELSVMPVSDYSCFNGIHKHMVQHPVNARELSRATLVGKNEYEFPRVLTSMHNNFPIWKYDAVTQDGDCGSPLVCIGPGDAPRVFGIHVWFARAELLMPGWAASIQVCADQVNAVIKSDFHLRVMHQGNFKHAIPELTHYPAKSEIAVATTFYNTNVLNWGSTPGYGRSMKTAFKPTSFHEQVKTFSAERGIFCDYAPPEFRGKMTEEGVYFSPFIHALRDTNMSTTSYDDVVEELVQRIAGHYGGPLTEHEAIMGVPGVFNSINLNSSMGPPVYGAKLSHITSDREEISPLLAQQIDELENILSRREVPRIIAEAVLKDEILKRGKNARVFCMLPAAFNIVCKQRFSILKKAMRSSYFASGCAVGLDMGSRKVEDLVEFLLHSQHLYALDVSRMDKCWTPQAWDSVALFIRRVTEISAGEKVGWEAWALVMSMKEAIIYLKGDYFTSFWNISGNDITVELNSILLLLMLQSCARHLGIEARVITYGDDNITGVENLLPLEFFNFLTERTGFVFTDDKKNTTPHAGDLSTVSFLKRSFVYEPRYKVWTAPLEESSIVKMLLFRGRSPLSPADHEAALVDAALRYALLHGRKKYADWRSFLSQVSTVAGPDYDEAMCSYVNLSYSDWIAREVIHNGSPSLGVKTQGNLTDMNISNVDDPVNAPTPLAPPQEVHNSTLDNELHSAEAAMIQTVGNSEVDNYHAPFAVYQEPPSFGLTDFLTRWTEIRTWTVNSTDEPMTMLGLTNVNSILLSNPAVAAKTRNFSYYRGDIEVMGVWSVPGNASGAYVAHLVPRFQAEDPLTSISAENCLSYEHSVLLQASASSDFTLNAPFFADQDVQPVTGVPPCSWMIYLTCISPIRTSIPGGVTIGHLKIYARFKPGYQLQVPMWQGKRNGRSVIQVAQKLREEKTISRTAKTIAGAAGMLSAVPVLGPIAASVAGASTTVAAIADFFGFSRHNDPLTSQTLVTRSVGNVANVDCNDNMDVSGFSCRNKISLDPYLVGGEEVDPMAFESLSERWVCVASFPWTAASDAGTILKSVPVTPGYCRGSLDTITPTGAGFCGLPFEYWRADAEYLVVIPASSLHRGALQVLYVPNDNPPGVSASVTNTGMNAVMDVSASTLYELSVAYSQSEPMKELRYVIDAQTIKPVGSYNGTLQFRVVNPLISQNPVDTIDVAIFVRFHNVQLAVPRQALMWQDDEMEGTSQMWEDAVRLQGKAPGDEDADCAPIPLDLVPGSGVPYPTHEITAGESILSMRSVAQRPTRILPQHYKTSGDSIFTDFDGCNSTTYSGFIRTTAAHLALSPFVNCAYSERVKVIPDIPCFIGAGGMTIKANRLPVASVLPQYPMSYSGPQHGAEFSIPYYYPRRGKPVGKASLVISEDKWVRVIASSVGHGGWPKLELYYSLGDDIRVGPYRGFPQFVMSRSAADLHPWMSSGSQVPIDDL